VSVRVHLVQIENFDGLYLFADEDQAAEFAALFSEDYMQDGSAEVLDRAAGAQLIAEVRAQLTVVDALPGAHPRSRPTV